MTVWQRGRLGGLACRLSVLLIVLTACTSSNDRLLIRSPTARSASPTAHGSSSTTPTAVALTPPTTGSSSPTSVPATRVRLGHLHPTPQQVTDDGLWWGVDSTSPINAGTLANVRDWYRGAPIPLVWGRYVSGAYRVVPGELAFARAHRIGVYFLVPDSDCSQCRGGGDLCGNDRTAEQANADARSAVADARRLRLPRGVTLYKDAEQVGTCYGELTAQYLLAWYRFVKNTRYVPAFYGNTNGQDYDFPRAYCAAVARDFSFAHEAALAQDEPEPQIGAARGAIGPANAPRFAPYLPHCATSPTVRIWQYAESGYADNHTDADEIRPDTHGILAPDGQVT